MLDMAQSLAVIEPPSQAFYYCSPATAKAVILPHMTSVVIQRIEQRLSDLDLSAKAASEKAGLSKDAIRNWQRKPDLMPTMRSLSALAPVLQTTVHWLMGETDDPSSTDKAPFGVRFGGIVEAGPFRPDDGLNQDNEWRHVPLPPDPRYPVHSQYAFEVRGDSMTEAHVVEGMWALAVDVATWERLHGSIPSGKLVVVARTRNGHPERELTVKRLRYFADRMVLQPESRNPAHEPIAFPLPLREDANQDVRIIAVVLQATWIYD